MELKQMFAQMSEKEYRDSEGVSYSFLKMLAEKGPRVIIEPQPKISGDGVVLGSIVDKLLTDPGYYPESEYEVLDIDIDLSGSTHISKILKFLKDNPDITLSEWDTSTLERLYNILEIKRAPKLDDVFWRQVGVITKMNGGSSFISPSELQLAKDMANAFKTHKYTAHLFSDEFAEENEVETIYQAKHFFEYKGTKVKMMLDMVKADHKNKVIYPFDIKTGSDLFLKQFTTYKYYLQGALYHYGLQDFINKFCPDYQLAPKFEFIYLGRNSNMIPVRYIMNSSYLNKGLEGYINAFGTPVPGVLQLIEDYSWYISNGIYDVTREVAESNGVITLRDPL